MKKSRKSFTILSCLSASIVVATPIVATSCAEESTVPTKAELSLDASALTKTKLIVGVNSANCSLKATYNKKSVKLSTVSFSYSEYGILSATWNKTTQNVQLTPKKVGSTNLTITAKDENNHSAKTTVSITVYDQEIVLNTADFIGVQLELGEGDVGCDLSAVLKKDMTTGVRISQVKFSYSKSNVVKATWNSSTQQVVLTPLSVGSTNLTITVTDSNGRVGVTNVSLSVTNPPEPVYLVLNIDSFKTINLVENGAAEQHTLTATLGEDTPKIQTVDFEYSKSGIVTASWNYNTQKVTLTPLAAGNTTITLNAVDVNGNSASASINVPVKAEVKKDVMLDVSTFNGISLIEDGSEVACHLDATYDDADVELNTVTFSSSPANIVSATWDKSSQQVKLTPVGVGSTTLTLNATDVNNHTGSATVSLIVSAKPIEYQLQLNTSAFNGIELIETAQSVVCALTATYGESPATLKTVNFSYSTPNIVSASWDNLGNVTVNPIKEGSTTLTINATDTNNHSATASIHLIVKPKSVVKTLQLNASGFNGIEMFAKGNNVCCLLTATYGDDPTTLSSATFSYSQTGIVSASWDVGTQSVILTPNAQGSTTLTINAIDSNNHSASVDVDLTVKAEKKLELNTTSFNGLLVIDGATDVQALLKATYGGADTLLKNVTFSYSESNIVTASWNVGEQKVNIKPHKNGTTTLTMNAEDYNNHFATASIAINVQDGSALYEFGIDTSVIDAVQVMGANRSYTVPTRFGNQETTMASATFSYGTSGIIEASFSNGQVHITGLKMGTTTLTINATDVYGHSGSATITIEVDSKVHKFINDRTFSIKGYKSGSATNGTMWLFYHDTPAHAGNNYTYFGLTNTHVTSGLWEFAKSYPSPNISIGYQNWASEAKGETSLIPYWEVNNNGESNQYNTLDTGWTNASDNNFRTLFTSYIKSDAPWQHEYYRDMTVCYLNLSAYASTPLGNRLNELNTYADAHNNKLVEFDDYSNIETKTTKVNMYSGGYPSKYIDSSATIYTDALKFQKPYFEDVHPGHIYMSAYDAIANFDIATRQYKNSLYDATGTYHKDTAFLMSAEFESQDITDGKMKFGAGASGSLAITASDADNEDTYKATGIYWGGYPETDPTFTFNAAFSPFIFNFGKKLEAGTDFNFIERFFDSKAYQTFTPDNDLNYTVYF